MHLSWDSNIRFCYPWHNSRVDQNQVDSMQLKGRHADDLAEFLKVTLALLHPTIQ